MGRSPKGQIIRGTWTAIEDKILTAHVRNYGEGNWARVPKETGNSLPSPPVLDENIETDQILTASSIEEGTLEKYLIANPNSNDELLLLTNDNDVPCNFLMDLDMGQMSFSDFLQTDIFSDSNNMLVNGPAPSYPDEASSFPEAMLQNWICEDGFGLELAMGP
ncbi:hypothetical protein H0E87_012017 [Populus deltoides]|uniref:Myb-like domain-containing protein n=1 Tax=Populus deltoides TaxID=3696 RepID=A0A8T2YHL1_POPDE|nr:hypothetical protein H0E87_012017 [Populus deltoides]